MDDVCNIAERNSEPGSRTVLEASPPYCKFLASASPCIEIQETAKIPRAKRYQSKNNKARCISSSTKNRRDESFEAQIKQLEHAKKLGILDMAPQDELEEEIMANDFNFMCREKPSSMWYVKNLGRILSWFFFLFGIIIIIFILYYRGTDFEAYSTLINGFMGLFTKSQRSCSCKSIYGPSYGSQKTG